MLPLVFVWQEERNRDESPLHGAITSFSQRNREMKGVVPLEKEDKVWRSKVSVAPETLRLKGGGTSGKLAWLYECEVH